MEGNRIRLREPVRHRCRVAALAVQRERQPMAPRANHFNELLLLRKITPSAQTR
jgi:hypothetical protein